MSANMELISPKYKHTVATAKMKETSGAAENSLLAEVVKHINETTGINDTAPVSIHGMSTREYCIIPCSYKENDPLVAETLQTLRGRGYYADLFRTALKMDTENTGSGYVLLVCWSPKVLLRGCSPKTYTLREGRRVPCSACSKKSAEDLATCKGCDVIKMWLMGVYPLDKKPDPCIMCHKAKQVSRDNCDMCPAKSLWLEAREIAEAKAVEKKQDSNAAEQAPTLNDNSTNEAEEARSEE